MLAPALANQKWYRATIAEFCQGTIQAIPLPAAVINAANVVPGPVRPRELAACMCVPRCRIGSGCTLRADAGWGGG